MYLEHTEYFHREEITQDPLIGIVDMIDKDGDAEKAIEALADELRDWREDTGVPVMINFAYKWERQRKGEPKQRVKGLFLKARNEEDAQLFKARWL